jgi:hypothetical protein
MKIDGNTAAVIMPRKEKNSLKEEIFILSELE